MFSKGLCVVSLLLFVTVLFYVLNLPENTLIYNGMQTVYTASITASGALSVTTVVWYLKKTHLSYATKVQGQVDAGAVKLDYEAKSRIMRLQHELKLSDSEMSRIDNSLLSSKIVNERYSSSNNTVKSAVDEGTETIKKELPN